MVAIRSRRSSDACAVGITIRARRRASKYIVEPEDLVKPLVEFVGVAVVLDGVNPVEEVNPVEDVVNVGVVEGLPVVEVEPVAGVVGGTVMVENVELLIVVEPVDIVDVLVAKL